MYFLYGIGMVLMSVSSLVTASGMVLMKHSATFEKSRPVLKRARLIIGLLCVTVLPIPLNSTALSFAPLSLLAPLGGLTIVFALVLNRLGPRELRESLGERSLAAVLLLLLGVGLVTGFGPQAPGAGQEAVEAAVASCARNTPFMILASLCLSGPLVLVACRILPPHYRPKPENASFVLLQSFSAAACGTFSTLLLKILSESTRDVFEGSAFLRGGPAALCITCLCLFAPCELYLLQRLIASSPVTFAVPAYESLLIALNVAMGGSFFREFERLGAAAAGFCVGIALVGAGVILLSYQHESSGRGPAKASEGDLGLSLQPVTDETVNEMPVAP